MNRFDEATLSKLNRYDDFAIGIYLTFWGLSSLNFKGENPPEKRFEGKNGSKSLTVSPIFEKRSGGIDTVSLSQLIYDLDVFYSIPREIEGRITPEHFGVFAAKAFLRMEKQGWEICFSNEGLYTDLINKYYPVKIIGSDYAPGGKKLFLINCWDEEFTKSYYEKYKNEYYVETHRALALLREWLVFEICDYFKAELAKKGVKLYLANWEWAQNNYLFPKSDITAAEKAKRGRFSVFNIKGQEENFEPFLKELYGEDYSSEYVKNVMDIPLISYYGPGSIHHSDMKSKRLNVLFGERKTTDTPESYDNTVYMLGGCVFFGYAIDDGNTIASFLQRKINSCCQKSVRVSNHAVWGGNIDETYNTLYELEYKENDVVIISYAGKIPIDDYDISTGLASCGKNGNFYYDGVVHCNKEGYAAVADTIYGIIESDLTLPAPSSEGFRLEKKNEFVVKENAYVQKVQEYLASVKNGLPPLFESGKTYGCAVMNCNPFTLGHRCLIEYAASRVDYFIVFVVEENKSYFPFEDRLALVKKGTADIDNVYVVPSGNLMISAVTFPGYFIKDRPDKQNVDSSKDVDIFGKYIAPALGITKRFVGDEPTDVVTRQYNETMKHYLPQYGIELEIIERKRNGESVISASTVRGLLKEKRFDELKCFVPVTTYSYLIEKFS